MDNLLEQSMLCDVDDHGEAVNDTLEVEVYIASFATCHRHCSSGEYPRN